MHRVGGGAFPTERGGAKSEEYCAKNNADGTPTHALKEELKEHGVPFEEIDGKVKYDLHHPRIVELMNSRDEFLQGVGLRLASKNYGATTSRPRRMGWLDTMAVRYALSINGPDLVLTKPNCIRGAKTFKLGVGYKGRDHFSRGEKISEERRACLPRI